MPSLTTANRSWGSRRYVNERKLQHSTPQFMHAHVRSSLVAVRSSLVAVYTLVPTLAML
jgi:hypothetical protein